MADDALERVKSALSDKAIAVQISSPRRVYVDVADENLTAAASCLFNDMNARYAIASGLQTEEGFEVLHHFGLDADHVVVTLRVKAEGESPEFTSLTPMIKGAAFIEREMHDLLGMKFRGHPNLERLILPDDWPEGVYPLRRGKPWEGKVEMPK